MPLMKRSFCALLALCCILSVAVSASELTINSGTTDVGGIDVLMNSATLPNSDTDTDIAWIEGILGAGFVLTYEKTNFGVASDFWTETNETGT
jgi:hypothetical protein